MKKLKFVFPVLTASIIFFFATESTLSTHTTGQGLLPDLVTLQPKDLSIEMNAGQKLLRFDNEVGNNHTGVLELFPQKIPKSGDNDDCDQDGNASNDRRAYQRIYQDKNNDGVFKRGVDKNSTTFEVGCMAYHPEHDHFHINNFASYELKDFSDTVVASSTKVTFCVIDIHRTWSTLLGSPNGPHYNICNRNSTQGLSIGWSDEYSSNLAGQYINVTSIADGDYCLVSTADPNNKLVETNDTNNSAFIKITLSGTTVASYPNTPCW